MQMSIGLKSLAGVLIPLLTIGCGSKVVESTGPRQPTSPAQVNIYQKAPDKYEDLGTVVVDLDGGSGRIESVKVGPLSTVRLAQVVRVANTTGPVTVSAVSAEAQSHYKDGGAGIIVETSPPNEAISLTRLELT